MMAGSWLGDPASGLATDWDETDGTSNIIVVSEDQSMDLDEARTAQRVNLSYLRLGRGVGRVSVLT